MLGAIYGDIAGSKYEFQEFDRGDIPLFLPGSHFTDDTLMTLAVAKALISRKYDKRNYQDILIETMRDIGHKYPNVLWGASFYKWLFKFEVPVPYNSFGNGAAMRIAPVGWVCDTLEETIELSKFTTEVTHNHPEGIKGAEAIAVSIFLARTGSTKEEIKKKMIEYYPELEHMTIESLVSSGYGRDDAGKFVTCQGSVPQSICAFLESNSVEDAAIKAISLNGDTDTQACMACAIAEAYFGMTPNEEQKALSFLPKELLTIYYSFDLIKKEKTTK